MGKTEGRQRRNTDKRPTLRETEGQVGSCIFTTMGAEAADRWLRVLGLVSVPRWYSEIAILADGDTRFDLNVYAEEWGFVFKHGDRTSWIRVTDVPFIHGRDDFDRFA